jgi:hypothetical protein
MARCGTGGWKPAEQHRCISLRSAGPPRWRRWRSARPTARWSSRSRRWSRRAGLPPTRALAQLIPSSQTAPPRHCVRLLTRPRLGWAGRLGVGLLRRGLGRGAGSPCARSKLRCRPPAPRAALPHGRPAAADPRAVVRPPVLRPSQLDHLHRAAAMRPDPKKRVARAEAAPGRRHRVKGLSKDPSRQDPARAVKPASPRPQRCRFRVCGQGRPRPVAASPPHAAPAAGSASAPRARLSAEDHVPP